MTLLSCHCEYAEVKPVLSETKDGNLILTETRGDLKHSEGRGRKDLRP